MLSQKTAFIYHFLEKERIIEKNIRKEWTIMKKASNVSSETSSTFFHPSTTPSFFQQKAKQVAKELAPDVAHSLVKFMVALLT